MPQAGGAGRRPRRRHPVTTQRRHGDTDAPNLWARQCDVAQPDPGWAGAMTSLGTAAGGWSLAALFDVPARTVVGWAMRHQSDAALGQEAWRMALGRRRPAAGLRHHAERGRQYACSADHAGLAAHGICGSMSRQGEWLEKAVGERCCGR